MHRCFREHLIKVGMLCHFFAIAALNSTSKPLKSDIPPNVYVRLTLTKTAINPEHLGRISGAVIVPARLLA